MLPHSSHMLRHPPFLRLLLLSCLFFNPRLSLAVDLIVFDLCINNSSRNKTNPNDSDHHHIIEPPIVPPIETEIAIYHAGTDGIIWTFLDEKNRDITLQRYHQKLSAGTASFTCAYPISTNDRVWLQKMRPSSTTKKTRLLYDGDDNDNDSSESLVTAPSQTIYEWRQQNFRLIAIVKATNPKKTIISQSLTHPCWDNTHKTRNRCIPILPPKTKKSSQRYHHHSMTDIDAALTKTVVNEETKNDFLDHVTSLMGQYAIVIDTLAGASPVTTTIDNKNGTTTTTSSFIKTRYSFSTTTDDGINLARDYLTSLAHRHYDSSNVRTPSFTCSHRFNDPSLDVTNHNIIMIKKGTLYPDEILVVGAHYDALAERGRRDEALGAEDNASGVAAVMVLAMAMVGFETERTIHFVAFGCEEAGLWGSGAYVEEAMESDDNIIAMINMDMISAMVNRLGILIETDLRYGSLRNIILRNVLLYTSLEYSHSYIPFGSDHVSFLSQGIPAVLGIDMDHVEYEYYHSAADTIDKLDLSVGHNITMAMAGAIVDIAGVVSGSEGVDLTFD